MTTDINDDLNIPVHAIPPVAVIAEHDLADLALVALVERLGYRAGTIDVETNRPMHLASKVVIARSAERLARSQQIGILRGARVIGLGIRVDHVDGIELPDSARAGDALRESLRRVLGPRAAQPGRVHLSPREQEVVVSYSLGATVQETSSRHFISDSTVRSHFRRVMQRYADAGRPVNNKTQLLIELMADGWVDRDRLMHR